LRHFRLLFRRRGSFTLFLRNEKRKKGQRENSKETLLHRRLIITGKNKEKTASQKKKIRLVLIRPEIYRPSTKE
jgi:hypothetical protein